MEKKTSGMDACNVTEGERKGVPIKLARIRVPPPQVTIDSCADFDANLDDEEHVTSVKNLPLPILLKFEDVEYAIGNLARNPVRVAVETMASQLKVEEMEHNKILKGVTGSIGPGEVLALMGPSGSGKTTLLKIIGGRLRKNVKGGITYNDVPFTHALKRRIGFVSQDDVLFPHLTVEETLVFAAHLRLPRNMTRQQRDAKVELIIKELGLERFVHHPLELKCRAAKIGGVSGGERKRTSIACEIIVDPSLLLLDEPTSGLDSTSANKLLDILHGIAMAGRTVVTTIHQPSSRMFHMFDKLLLISEGCSLYHGEAKECMGYFSSLGFMPELAMNPAEFLLDLATGNASDIRVPEVLTSVSMAPDFGKYVVRYLKWKCKYEKEPRDKELNHRMTKAPKHLQSAIQIKKNWTVPWSEQFLILTKRTYRERCGDYLDKIRFLQAIGVAVLLGLLWWKSNTSTEAQLRDQVGLMFYICIFWTSSSIFAAVYVFPFEKVNLVKERKADMYRLSAYYVGSTLCDMVVHIFYPTIFMVVLYFMAGFKRTATTFLLTLLSINLIVVTSQGAGELLGAAILSVKRAGLLASLVLMLFLLTGGYYVQHLPRFMRWLKYTSFMHYGFRLLLKVQYSAEQKYECESSGGCRSLQSSPSLNMVDLDGGMEEALILLAMALGYRILAYTCLKRRITVSPF